MTEREILEQSIKEHQNAVDAATDRLTKLGKPELKHGDYGYDTHLNRNAPADPRLYIDGHSYGCVGAGGNCDSTPLVFVEGNIFDDLKRDNKGLEKFELVHEKGETCLPYTRVRLLKSGRIALRLLATEEDYCLPQVERLHQKLGRLINTAKKKGVK